MQLCETQLSVMDSLGKRCVQRKWVLILRVCMSHTVWMTSISSVVERLDILLMFVTERVPPAVLISCLVPLEECSCCKILAAWGGVSDWRRAGSHKKSRK